MHVEKSGEGRSVLFLHGGGVSGWMWKPVLTALDGGVRAIVPDLPGHGRSADEPYVSHDHAIALLTDLIEQTAPAGLTVVGFSLGAQLAIRLASTPGVPIEAAVIVSAETHPAPMPGLTLWLLGVSAPLARQEWFAKAQAKQLGVPDELFADYLRDSRAISRDTLVNSVGENIRFDLPAVWSEFRGAATVMVGERERRLMLESARHTHDSLPGSELRIVPGTAHDLPLTRPDAVAEAIRTTLGTSR